MAPSGCRTAFRRPALPSRHACLPGKLILEAAGDRISLRTDIDGESKRHGGRSTTAWPPRPVINSCEAASKRERNTRRDCYCNLKTQRARRVWYPGKRGARARLLRPSGICRHHRSSQRDHRTLCAPGPLSPAVAKLTMVFAGKGVSGRAIDRMAARLSV